MKNMLRFEFGFALTAWMFPVASVACQFEYSQDHVIFMPLKRLHTMIMKKEIPEKMSMTRTSNGKAYMVVHKSPDNQTIVRLGRISRSSPDSQLDSYSILHLPTEQDTVGKYDSSKQKCFLVLDSYTSKGRARRLYDFKAEDKEKYENADRVSEVLINEVRTSLLLSGFERSLDKVEFSPSNPLYWEFSKFYSVLISNLNHLIYRERKGRVEYIFFQIRTNDGRFIRRFDKLTYLSVDEGAECVSNEFVILEQKSDEPGYQKDKHKRYFGGMILRPKIRNKHFEFQKSKMDLVYRTEDDLSEAILEEIGQGLKSVLPKEIFQSVYSVHEIGLETFGESEGERPHSSEKRKRNQIEQDDLGGEYLDQDSNDSINECKKPKELREVIFKYKSKVDSMLSETERLDQEIYRAQQKCIRLESHHKTYKSEIEGFKKEINDLEEKVKQLTRQ